MARSTGAWVQSGGYNCFRTVLDLSGSTLIVYVETAAGATIYYGSNSLARSGSWSGQATIPMGMGGSQLVEVYRQTISTSGTYTAAFTVPNVGTSTATMSASFGTKPGPPSGFTITRSGETTATLTFTKGSGAASTQITASKDGGAWYELANPTGSSQAVTGLVEDAYWRFNLYSKNAAGTSKVIGPYAYYTRGKTPTKPKLGAGRNVTWTLPAKYAHGTQIQRSDNGGNTATTYDLDAVTSWVDPVAQSPLSQYRVRSWAGPSTDEAKTWSAWSPWSEAAMGLTYKPPAITALSVRRCNSAGQLTELGTYLRVVSSGTVAKVPNASGTETNKVTRTVRWRKAGTTTWSQSTIVNAAVPANWSSAAVTIGAGKILATESWEVQYTVQDTYSSLIVAATTIPTSKVAFSMGPSGTGHGKTWERGALDVGGDAYIEGTLIADKLAVTDPNLITVDGVDYQSSGIVACGNPSWTQLGSFQYGFTPFTPPFMAPPGWTFQVWPVESSGYVTCYLRDTGTQIRVFGIGGATLTKVGWHLVKN